MLHRKTESVNHAVMRRQINLAYATRQRSAAREGGDRRPTVPQFLAGLAVERVEDRARRTPRLLDPRAPACKPLGPRGRVDDRA